MSHGKVERERAERWHSQACVLWEYLLVFICVPDLKPASQIKVGVCYSQLSKRCLEADRLPRSLWLLQFCGTKNASLLVSEPGHQGASPVQWAPELDTRCKNWGSRPVVELPLAMPALWIAVGGRVWSLYHLLKSLERFKSALRWPKTSLCPVQ